MNQTLANTNKEGPYQASRRASSTRKKGMFWNDEGPLLEMYRAYTWFEKGENSLYVLCFGVIKSRMGWGLWRLFFNTDEPIR